MRSRIKSFFDPQILLASSFVAILVALAFPPVGLWPLAWLGFVFWSYLFTQKQNLISRAPLFFFWYSFFVHLFGFYWVAYTLREFGNLSWGLSSILTILGLVAVGAGSYFFGWIFLKLHKHVSLVSRYPHVFLALFFVLWDFLDFRIYPWTPVMSVGGQSLLLASAGYLGTNGWRFLFFLSAVGICYLVQRKVPRREKILNVFSAMVFIWSVPIFLGFWNRKSLMETYKNSRPVAILQGNVGNMFKKNAKLGEIPSVRRILTTYRDLVEEASIHFYSEIDLPPGVRPIYFWPETSFPGDWNRGDFLGQELFAMVDRSKGLHLVGAYESDVISLGDTQKDVDFNVLTSMDPTRLGNESYRKMIRMPFGEYAPGDHWMPEIYEYLPMVNHFGAGDSYQFLNTTGEGPLMVPLICYEILFESFVNDFVNKAKKDFPNRELFLVNPSNDSWYGPTSQPFQNLFLSQWHAARLRLPLIRPANTGLSAVVAPWGEILARGHLDEPEVIYSDVPVR